MSVSPEFANSGNQEQKQDPKPSFLEQMESGVRGAYPNEELEAIDSLNARTRFENLKRALPGFALFVDYVDRPDITPELANARIEVWNKLMAKEPTLEATGYRQTFFFRLSNGIPLGVEYFQGGAATVFQVGKNERVMGTYTSYDPPIINDSEALADRQSASLPRVEEASESAHPLAGFQLRMSDGWDVEKFISPEQAKYRRDQLDTFDSRIEQLHVKAHNSRLFDPTIVYASIYVMPHATPQERAERLQKYQVFKSQYTEWQKQISLLYTQLVKIIRRSPDMSLDEMYDLVLNQGEARDISPYALIKFMEGVRGYEARHFVVRTLRETFQDDKELFRQLFNQEPSGAIEVIERPMSLYIRCHSEADYALAYAHGDTQHVDRAHAKLSAGAFLHGFYLDTIMLEKATGSRDNSDDESSSASTLAHEEQHAINRLLLGELTPVVVAINNDSEEHLVASVTDFCRARRESIENQAKDEILAYIAGGGHSAEFIDYIIKLPWKNLGLYDYASQNGTLPWLRKLLRAAVDERYRPKAEGIILAQFIDEYHKNIDEAVDSVKQLATFGYSKQFMIGLLAGVPLWSWPAEVRRLGQGRMSEDAVIDPFAEADRMTWVLPYEKYTQEGGLMRKLIQGVRRIRHQPE